MLRLGNKEVVDIKVGARQAVAAYLGSELVWQKSTPLPYDAEVEYIESTGTQYIDTGIYPLVGYTYDFVVSSTRGYNAIFGSARSGVYTQIVQAGSAKFALYNSAAISQTDLSLSSDIVYRIIFGPSAITVNGVEKEGHFGNGSIPYSVYLFARNYLGAANMLSAIRIHSFKILNGNEVVIDLIPVRFTNELGQPEGAMYNRLGVGGMNPDGSLRTDGLYRNRGTDAFLYGADKPA